LSATDVLSAQSDLAAAMILAIFRYAVNQHMNHLTNPWTEPMDLADSCAKGYTAAHEEVILGGSWRVLVRRLPASRSTMWHTAHGDRVLRGAEAKAFAESLLDLAQNELVEDGDYCTGIRKELVTI